MPMITLNTIQEALRKRDPVVCSDGWRFAAMVRENDLEEAILYWDLHYEGVIQARGSCPTYSPQEILEWIRQALADAALRMRERANEMVDLCQQKPQPAHGKPGSRQKMDRGDVIKRDPDRFAKINLPGDGQG